MIVINSFFCIWLSIERYYLSTESSGQKAPVEQVSKVSDLYHIVTGLMLFSALVLGDALRRIRKALTTNPHLLQNQTTMMLHVSILSVHTLTFSVASALVFRAFANPSPKNIKAQCYARMVLFLSTAIVQGILMYLLMRMTKPITIEDANYEGNIEADSAFSQDRREQDLTMLHYIRNMPETVKFNNKQKLKIGQS